MLSIEVLDERGDREVARAESGEGSDCGAQVKVWRDKFMIFASTLDQRSTSSG